MSERTPSAFLHNVSRLPLFLLAFGASALSMFVPAFYALSLEEHQEAQAFGYTAILGFVLFAMIGIAMAGRRPRHGTLGPLLSLFSVMVILPMFLALPLHQALRTTTYFNAYIEMVSAITTTGVTLFDDPDRLSAPLHLWRAIVG